MYDIIVIGAGPAGLSAAFDAKQRGLSCIVLEKSSVANTIRDYPLGKAIFSDASDVELEPSTFTPAHKPTREEVLHYYQGFAEKKLPNGVRTNTQVLQIEKRGDGFSVHTTQGDFASRFVIVAVGGMGTINTLGVDGEENAGLAYHYQEIRLHKNERVLVIGAGNSAGEAVCDLQQEGAQVTWIVRRPSLDLSIGSRATPIHPTVRKPVESLLVRGLIDVLFDAQVLSFSNKTVRVAAAGVMREIAYDSGFALLGRRPDHKLVQATGAACDADGYPIYDSHSGETSIPGLFVVGHCTREINLKNAVTRPRSTLEAIAARGTQTQTPAPLAQPVREERVQPLVVAVSNPLAWVLSDPGALAVGLADYQMSQLLAYAAHESSAEHEQTILQNTAVIRAKLATLAGLHMDDSIEDIVVTTEKELHVLRLVQAKPSMFLMMILDRGHANLALARHRLKEIETQLSETPSDDHSREHICSHRPIAL